MSESIWMIGQKVSIKTNDLKYPVGEVIGILKPIGEIPIRYVVKFTFHSYCKSENFLTEYLDEIPAPGEHNDYARDVVSANIRHGELTVCYFCGEYSEDIDGRIEGHKPECAYRQGEEILLQIPKENQ